MKSSNQNEKQRKEGGYVMIRSRIVEKKEGLIDISNKR